MPEVVVGPGDYFNPSSVMRAYMAEEELKGYKYNSWCSSLRFDLSALNNFEETNSYCNFSIEDILKYNRGSYNSARIIKTDDCIFYVSYNTIPEQNPNFATSATINAYSKQSQEHVNSVLCDFVTKYHQPLPEPEGDFIVPVKFSYLTSAGISISERNISTHSWPSVRKNYSSNIQNSLDILTSFTELDSNDGKILLLWGVPGTGKSNIIRTLMWEWREWANFTVIVDPDVLLDKASYIFQTLMQESSKWRFLVLEDCGEFISSNAKSRSGQGLSKLLNMADGILGQGQNLGFILTTNEPITKLEPAVARPGRCLANLEVGEFSSEESSNWLGYPVYNSMTLADLYARKNSTPFFTEAEQAKESTGAYL